MSSNICLKHSIPMSNGSFSNLKSSDRMGVTTTAAPRQKSATKKVNKWDAVMSKISYDAKPKPALNAKEVIKSKVPQPAQKGARNGSLVNNDSLVVRHRQLTHLRNERNASGPTVRSSSLLIDNHENDRYSVQSSTESESSLQESSGTSSSRTRVKKNGAESYRQTSDLSSASDNSASQRRLNRTVVKNTKGASRLATVTSLASSSNSQSTNQIEPRTDRRKPISFASATPLNPGCKTVPSRMSLPFSRTAALHLKPLRDRNRLGPDGKLSATDSDGVLSSSQPPNSQNGVNPPIKSNNSSLANPPVSPNLIADNTNNNAPSAPCNNQTAIVVENTRLKEELSRQYDLIADLKTQLEQSNSCRSNSKMKLEAQVKFSNQRFLAMAIAAQMFDFQRTTIKKKLSQERTLAQGREDQLVERLEEIQNLRVEFERERECIQEELSVMRKTDESQVEKLKELGVELSKKEELLLSMTKSHEDEVAELKRKCQEELEATKEKYREEVQEEVKTQVIKRTLSSPHPSNTPNDLLHKEIASLQVVIEMRNEEIRNLRQELLTQKSYLEDLSSCKEQNKGLLAKVEDLNAQLNKSRNDKHDMQKKYQDAEDNASQALVQVSQLQYENEQLKWRLQSIRTDARVSELMSKSAVQLGCDSHLTLDYETAVNSLRLDVDMAAPNGCVKQ